MKFLPNTIINFHAVYDPKWMENVFLLLKRAYNIVSLNEIKDYYSGKHKLRNACHITFDDGHNSFYETVFPLIKKHQIPLSIYVSTEATIKRKNFWFQEIRDYDKTQLRKILFQVSSLDAEKFNSFPLGPLFKSLPIEIIWEVITQYQRQTRTPAKECVNMSVYQLQELHKSGLVAIGAHTQIHPILSNESDAVVEKEIKTSIQELSDMLDSAVEAFAYPNGQPVLDFGKREINILKTAGIKIAFSTENKRFSLNDDSMAVPRNGLSYGKSAFVKFKLLSGANWTLVKKILKGRQENDYRRLLRKGKLRT